jgi:MraZ protein
MLERLFHGQSFPTSVDDTGRLVIPQRLREKIGIKAEAYFIASGDTFQIWTPETFQQDQEKTNAWLQSLPEDFDPLIYLDTSDRQVDE